MIDTGLVGGNKQNKIDQRPDHRRSNFNLSYNLFHTVRFGEISSHFVMKAERGDTIPLRSEHDLRTYSMKAPLMQDIEYNKAYFAVPMEAILPLNWYKIYTNPVQGDDIDAQTYGTSIEKFYYNYSLMLRQLWNMYQNTTNDPINRINALLRFFQMGQMLYSKGSLMWQLGYKNETIIVQDQTKNFDNMYEKFLNAIIAGIEATTEKRISIWIGNNAILINDGDKREKVFAGNYITLRHFVDMYSHEADVYFMNVDSDDEAAYNEILNQLKEWETNHTWKRQVHDEKSINIDKVLAYQIVCAHYFSNDHVDYIYSAELYRQNIFSLADNYRRVFTGQWYSNLEFTYNGVRTNADYLSAAIFNSLINHFLGNITVANFNDNTCQYFYQYMINIFWFQNSLRYRDYFTGARTNPLAVGNVNVNVNTGDMTVNVIDITRNIQMQRFLNSVNRTGRKWASYLEGLIKGKDVGYDYHDPMFLGSTKDIAYAIEVENTGTAQQSEPNSVTSIVKSNAERFAFEFTPDRPSIVIGVEYFDIARNYIHNMERDVFHVTRFDMFNPEMEFIGDQEIDGAEINMDNDASIFAYQGRYQEYKQRINSMVGGFVEDLPGYAFKANEEEFGNHYNQGEIRLSPYFIRSHPYELDKFYVSLTGRTPTKYFHFIIKSKNNLQKVTRKMARNPEIL